MSNIVGTEWWHLDLPEDWEVEDDGESLMVSDPDGVGSIEISTLKCEGEVVGEDDLAAFAEDLLVAKLPHKNVSVGPFKGWLFAYKDEDYWCREWYLASGDLFLYVTYECDLEHKGMDDEVVDDILGGFQLLEEKA